MVSMCWLGFYNSCSCSGCISLLHKAVLLRSVFHCKCCHFHSPSQLLCASYCRWICKRGKLKPSCAELHTEEKSSQHCSYPPKKSLPLWLFTLTHESIKCHHVMSHLHCHHHRHHLLEDWWKVSMWLFELFIKITLWVVLSRNGRTGEASIAFYQYEGNLYS